MKNFSIHIYETDLCLIYVSGLISKLCKSHKINRELFSNFLFLKKDYIYLFERESEREWAWAGWRAEGERESQADSVPSTEPNAGLHLTTLRSWPEPKSRVQRLTDWATQAPLFSLFLFTEGICVSLVNCKYLEGFVSKVIFINSFVFLEVKRFYIMDFISLIHVRVYFFLFLVSVWFIVFF